MRIIQSLFGPPKAVWEGTPVHNINDFMKSFSRTGKHAGSKGFAPTQGAKTWVKGYQVHKDPKKAVWFLMTPDWHFAGMYATEAKAHRARKLANAGKLAKAAALAIGAGALATVVGASALDAASS